MFVRFYPSICAAKLLLKFYLQLQAAVQRILSGNFKVVNDFTAVMQRSKLQSGHYLKVVIPCCD